MTREKQKREGVTAAVLAKWLGVSRKTVFELAKAGVAVRVRRGLYALEESVTRYCEHVRRTASQRGGEASLAALRDERIKIAREQADALAFKNAAARGSLLDAAEVEREWSDILRAVRAGMLSVPSRAAQRLPHLSKHDVSAIDAEVRAVLKEMGNNREA